MSTLLEAGDAGTGPEADASEGETDEFADPRSCLDREVEQSVVASARPPVMVGCIDQ